MASLLPPMNLSALGWFAFVAALTIGDAVISPIVGNAVGSLKKGGN